LCEDGRVIFARRLTIALLLAGFRMWRRLPPEDRQKVVSAIRHHAPRVAASLSRRRRVEP
jgi:hypothetical protein